MASSPPTVTSVSKLSSPAGPVPEDAASKPHHVLRRGVLSRFRNPHPSYPASIGFGTIVRNLVWPLITGQLKLPDTSKPALRVRQPAWLPSRTASDRLRATWLGHACCYVEFPSGLRVLFDPVLEDRCSPFTVVGPKRYTPQPCSPADIPAVDAVVISHSHYDHLSLASVVGIQRRHPHVHFFVGLGLETWFRRGGLRNVTELDWWEDAELTVEAGSADGPGTRISARVSCLPCQHTSGRTPFDRDRTLWCSWAVRSGHRSVWFGGDTGYRAVPRLPPGSDDYGPTFSALLPRCPHFRHIGDLRGPFDLGLIPIGAYHPRVAFSGMHANPFDAVEIFAETRCRFALAIHWGTWALTLEHVDEPPILLREALRRRDLPEEGVFDVCEIGESREFP
ncbi:NAPE-hydrolyzing phospholipase D [Ophiocordyceps camponoti-floridani]|uniref:NAPE-hydrolyzing phospholipase D n=1 Tax=Ophiocordyceps camponoti-floridani TaxID=2030778 RepID=A0A8H4VHJ9_9HYPO|nr:NAPE-hydrolyzing phospholipase D [Ophiocordyceps camponoti-floridani]